MKAKYLQFEEWLDRWSDQYLRPWHALVAFYIYMLTVMFFNNNPLYGPLSVLRLITFFVTLTIFVTIAQKLKHRPRSKRFSAHDKRVATLVGIGLIVVTTVVLSLTDDKPFYRAIPGGFELDNGGSLISIFIVLVPAFLATMLPIYLIIRAVRKRRTINNIPTKDIFQ